MATATKKKTPAAMPVKSMPSKSEDAPSSELMEFLCDEIKDIYWAENHLVKALPKMQKAATSKKLATAIGDHLKQTMGHVKRLDQVFESLGKKPQAKKCDAMEGILKEGESILEDTDDGSATRDVGIILASQKVEHYEIATYTGLISIAKTLGLTEVADLMTQTLGEEQTTSEKLTDMANSDINPTAAKS